jgi:hypothetical protein
LNWICCLMTKLQEIIRLRMLCLAESSLQTICNILGTPSKISFAIEQQGCFRKWIQCWYNSQKQFFKVYDDDTIYACFSTKQMVCEILYIKSTKVYAHYVYMI